ncbi:MAG: hypothetical protein ACXVXB_02220 [Nocardioidaceae bacterium]
MVPSARSLARGLVTAVLAAVALAVLTSFAAPAEAAPHRQRTMTSTSASSPGRAMWVWTRPTAKNLVTFAAKRNITTLYLSVPVDLPGNATALTWVKNVSAQAAPLGISLQALGGDPAWVDDPAGAVAWETAALSTGLFAGAHLDFEPWGNAAWGTDQAGVVRGYLDTLARLKAATTLPVEADVSFWLWTISTDDGRPLDQAVLDIVDGVTVMSYRNTVTGPDSITDIGAHILATAAAAGKPARLAVETNNLGSDPVSMKQTFYGQTEAALNRALDAVDAAEAGSPSYAGMAVEDYKGYNALS